MYYLSQVKKAHILHIPARCSGNLLLGFNHRFPPFYAACCSDKLSRGCILYLLIASFKKRISQCHNPILYSKIDDHGTRRGDTGQILAQRQSPVASKVALIMLCRVKRDALGIVLPDPHGHRNGPRWRHICSSPPPFSFD